MEHMVQRQCMCREVAKMHFCGFRYLKKQYGNLQGAVRLRGDPTPLTPPFPVLAKAKVGMGQEREEKWCLALALAWSSACSHIENGGPKPRPEEPYQ